MSIINERVQEAVNLLQSKGRYTVRPMPLHIADIDYAFDFDAVLEGPMDDHNLVLVLNAELAPLIAVERRIRALTVALRRTGSSRPLTLVLVTPHIDPQMLAPLQAVCRVLPFFPAHEPETALAPLLPLPLPQQSQTFQVARDVLLAKFVTTKDSLLSNLMRAADLDSAAVEKAVLAAIRRAATVSRNPKESHDSSL